MSVDLPRPDAPRVKTKFPEKLEPLFAFGRWRYKVMRSGRGAGKTWNIARALLIMGGARTLRVGCFREIQNSIAESVHQTLASQIDMLGIAHLWTVQRDRIFNPATGSEFIFSGLRSLNVTKIKSYEGLDVAWVEEAQTISKRSWDILIPTIRKPGSEIWVSFNPELETDETYRRFVVEGADDPDVLNIVLRYDDNPWWPETLEKERLRMQRVDPTGYLTTYEGHCRQFLDGAIYAAELRQALADKRITRVPYEPTRPVHTFWDLGFSDATAIWLVQAVGLEYRIIGYIEGHSQALDWYVRELKALPCIWGADHLPHDARAKSLQTGRSTEEMLRSMDRDVRIVPTLTVADGISAARSIFSRCWFDEEKTREGLNRLRRYAYDVDDNGQRSKLPMHDDNSHGADAFRYLAVGFDTFGEHRKADNDAGLPIQFVRRKGIA